MHVDGACDGVAGLVPDLGRMQTGRLDQELLEAINRTGEAFLAHASFLARFTLWMALGGLRTTSQDVEARWEFSQETGRAASNRFLK
jgi:hypothetical protein